MTTPKMINAGEEKNVMDVDKIASGKWQKDCLHGEIAGDLPRSGGLISPFCSNIARRFLTALMVADFQALESQDLKDKLRSVGPPGSGRDKVAGAVGFCSFCSRQPESTRG